MLQVGPEALVPGEAGLAAVGAGRGVDLDAVQEGVAGGFIFRQPYRGVILRASHFPPGGRAPGPRGRRVPAQGVGENAAHLVIQVVPRGQHLEAFREGERG